MTESHQQDVQDVIDAAWGDGLPTEDKLEVFDQFWSTIDSDFACFQDIVDSWDDLRSLYRPEVEAGVSRGRFAAIMSRLSLSLMEAHTQAIDTTVATQTSLASGVPILVIGGWAFDRHFGAGLTPLADGRLLVYQTVPAHPLGLEPGDLVLGYDGRRWDELFPELLEAGLPVAGFWGSSPDTFEHSWMMAAGMNWHLFDTIDIQKHATGEVQHLSTSLMVGQSFELINSEQLEVPGVPMPDVPEKEIVTWGIIDGTSIGYIYGWGWMWEAEQEFYDAVFALMFQHDTEGLIIDFRFNVGGNMFMSNAALRLLFDTEIETIGFVRRCNPDDHLAMCRLGITSNYDINGDPSSGYDHPIAVLTGPGAVSSGDQVALRVALHPQARVFGKSTNTAFNSPAEIEFGSDDWSGRFAEADAFLVSSPDEYLTHDPFLVDEEVWLTPDDVAAGRDTVVEAALRWIDRVNHPPRQRRVDGRLSSRLPRQPNP